LAQCWDESNATGGRLILCSGVSTLQLSTEESGLFARTKLPESKKYFFFRNLDATHSGFTRSQAQG
jgi:hypothetical protein